MERSTTLPSTTTTWIALLLLGGSTACTVDDENPPIDGGHDHGSDAGAPTDASVVVDSAAVDAATGSDGGTQDGRTVVDPCAGTVACETFDSLAAGPVDAGWGGWKLEMLSAHVDVADGPARGGRVSKALHIDLPGEADARALLELDPAGLFPATGYHLFGRMRLFGEVMPADDEWKRHALLYASGTNPDFPDAYAHVSLRGDAYRTPMANYFTNQPSFIDCAGGGATQKLPVKQWVCYEFELDAAKSEVRVWFDGATQPAMEVLQKGNYCGDGNIDRLWTFPTLKSLAVGLHSYDAYAYRMWIDDVAFGTTRLGCPD